MSEIKHWKDTVMKPDQLAEIAFAETKEPDYFSCPTPLQQARVRQAIANKQAEISFKAGIKEVGDFINNLIIGIEGCKFEGRLDGDKGCIVLDINENQWHIKLKEWGV